MSAGVDRLAHVRGCASQQRLVDRSVVVLAREHDDRRVRMALAQQGEAAEAVEARQLEVEQDEVGPRARDERLDLEAGAGRAHDHEAVGTLEDLAHRAQHQWVVLDDHNARLHGLQSTRDAPAGDGWDWPDWVSARPAAAERIL